MNIYFLEKCNDIFTNRNIVSNDSKLFFNSHDDYSDFFRNELYFTIQESFFNNKKINIGTITNLIPIYDINDIVDESSIIIEYNGNKLNELDLLVINNCIVFVKDIINSNRISIEFIDKKKSDINNGNDIIKIFNYKKYYRIYKSLSVINKCKLRNLLIPPHHLTKLMKSKLKSDFWNQDQRNILSNVIKNTENKKIHVINGFKNTGKSTLILGLIQNYLSRFKNIKLLISSSNYKSLFDLSKRLITQSSIIIPNDKWIMIVGDINYIDKNLHPFVISTYISKYKSYLKIIEDELKKLQDQLIDKTPIIININNKLNELPIQPYSLSNITISELLNKCNSQSDYDYVISQIMVIIDKWTNSEFINTKLILHCNLIISSICSSGCDSMGLYKNNIIFIDDAESIPEIEALIPIQDSTEKLLLFGNNNIEYPKNIFNRMIKGECSLHSLSEQYNV
jgi:hypothetical protein